MSHPSSPILIVGAGPAGCACALQLAELGVPSILIDKATFPRDKICGDALSGKVISALRHINPDIPARLHAWQDKSPTYGIRFTSPSGEQLDVPFKLNKPDASVLSPGLVAKRMHFDQFLFELAQEEPLIQTVEGYSAKTIQRTSEGIQISDGERRFQGAAIVGADGAHSIVNKQLGAINFDRNHHSAGVRAYYKGITGFHEDRYLELHFLKDLLPGYLWIFPLPNGQANVGLGMLSADIAHKQVNLRKQLSHWVENHPALKDRFAQAKQIGKTVGFGLPLGSKRYPLSGDRFVLTGDAAALIDPFSGEGIGNALYSGRIAARNLVAALEAGDLSAKQLNSYDKEVYRKLGPELKLGYQMQKLIKRPRLFNFLVRKANKHEQLRTIMTTMFDDLEAREQLKSFSFYWKWLVS
ncbi:geranylgeranyl reductase family protein [Pontibacter sp. G13]|uniref:NAD(P)/FAD-dependent oxidoreductase n=1 Tax=Pontibacter sp. G13 TaxID=3074898 RepID=UPI002889A965|nr:geranylgeranyl reductase family protein [Pontibacter sp. G13]WNJ19504.1 geranylgeranyl reductase family protein [Pontibacter sp. G13]